MLDSVRFLNLEYFFNWITELFTEGFAVGTAGSGFFSNVRNIITLLGSVIFPLIILILVGFIVYYFLKIEDLRKEERERTFERLYRKQKVVENEIKNERWEHVIALFESTAPSDWRVAVIEADGMLEDLVTRMGYEGSSLGEKLRSIDRGHFPVLQDAWDAHLIRNKVAHEGMRYQLDEREKNRAFRLYEKVFSETGLI